jgi:pentatricopeptide repeat protein
MNSEWNKFIKFTETAAKKIPIDRLDFQKYNLIPTFNAISKLDDINERISELVRHEDGSYILNTITLLYLHIGQDRKALHTFRLNSPQVVIGKSLKIYPKVCQPEQNELGPWHLYIMKRLSNKESLAQDANFNLLQLKMMVLAKVPLAEILMHFDEIIGNKMLKKPHIRRAFDMMIRICGFLHFDTHLVNQLYERRSVEFQLDMKVQDFLLLMELHARLKRFDKVLEIYEQITNDEIKKNEDIIYQVSKAYFGLGYMERAAELIKSTASVKRMNFWKVCLSGFSKFELLKRDMMEILKLYVKMVEEGIKPDIEIYHSILIGFSKRKFYGDVLDWFDKLKKAGFEPDRYTYSILNGCYWEIKDTDNPKLLQYTAQFESILTQLSHLESQVSVSQRLLINVRRNRPGYISYFDIIEKLELNRECFRPELYAGLLSYFIRERRDFVDKFIEYIRANNVPLTVDLYSLFILSHKMKGRLTANAWKAYDEMLMANIAPNEAVYRNLLAVAFKTNDVKKCRKLVSEITSRELPMSRAFYRDVIYILTSDRNRAITYSSAAQIRLNDSIQSLNHEVTNDTSQPVYTQLAFQIFVKRIEIAGLSESLIAPFHRLVQASTIHSKSQQLVQDIYILLQKLSEHKLYPQISMKFFQMILGSNNWPLSLRIFSIAGLKDDVKNTYLKVYFQKLGEEKSISGLYTAFVNLYPNHLNSDLVAVILEQIGLSCKSLSFAKRVWEKLRDDAISDDIRWVYVKVLLSAGNYEEVTEVVNRQRNIAQGGN